MHKTTPKTLTFTLSIKENDLLTLSLTLVLLVFLCSVLLSLTLFIVDTLLPSIYLSFYKYLSRLFKMVKTHDLLYFDIYFELEIF